MWTESKAKAKEKANANAKRKCKGTTNRWWSDYTKSMVDVLTNAFFLWQATYYWVLTQAFFVMFSISLRFHWLNKRSTVWGHSRNKGNFALSRRADRKWNYCKRELRIRQLIQNNWKKNALIVSYVSPECLLNISFNIYFYFVFLHTGTAI